ncbi:hypothetical protein [Paenibacillus hamazuiensis]|uniref:hypothetical protein n=1 Tax=Paenibacillus hamazuiensis TaxID=2936508 RepID=UPI00200CA0CD|nr:hypothetical protein [Paenibacillus hamazuiensis]
MPDVFSDKLMKAKERKLRFNKAERRREELLKRQREQERLIVQLEMELEAEQADVDKLTGLSLTNLFHTILRSKEEQLEMERQQVLAATLKLMEAKQALADIQDEIIRVGDELADCREAEREYEQLMKERETFLRSSASSSAELAEMDARIADQTILLKEINEAWSAGKGVLANLVSASSSLEKAENWGKWDLWGGGGMISTHVKHNHVDDAKRFIHSANRQLLRFRDELADLKRSIHIEMDIGGMLKMADYWFDGLIADWVVQGRIKNAQERTLEAIRRVGDVVGQLQAEHSAAEAALQSMTAKRTAWIEGNGR